MPFLRCLIMATTIAATTAGAQEPAPGITRALAGERRARISSVHYELAFALYAGTDTVEARARVRFEVPDDEPPGAVVLDFAGAKLGDLRVNGIPQIDGYRQVADHLVITSDNLVPGANSVEVEYEARVAPTGAPITVFRDQQGERDYLYTLVVPADAHRLFPCFDQPDLKATCSLQLTVPGGWVATANGAEKEPPEELPDGRTRYVFARTKPISTYLMAFAAGPFQVVEAPAGASGVPVRIFVRPDKLASLETDRIATMHEAALSWLGDYFAYPYPFGKLDLVLCPGFPYGGMEHAGAIFYRESALVFDHRPTESELVRRSTLIYHEVSHQWFGNLVTMEWFDDLWLKEGFATFIAYHLLDALESESEAWLRFHQRVEPAAYRVDSTPGTTPIYQQLDNLDDAKSAYGAIVYNKAPAVLRELHGRLGGAAFRSGLRQFLRQHEFGNARWEDLVAALEASSGTELDAWSKRWILTAGMPRVRAHWRAENGELRELWLTQESVQGGPELWPLRIEVLVVDAAGKRHRLQVEGDGRELRPADLSGVPAPRYVLLNASDVAYGQFLLDPKSREVLLEHPIDETDPLLRAVALTELFDGVREAEIEPRRYVELALRLLARERDPQTHEALLGTLATCLRRYLHRDDRRALGTRTAQVLLSQLREGAAGLELQAFRFLARYDPGDAVLGLCRALLDGEHPMEGLELGQRDRYLALAALLAAGHAGGYESMLESPADTDAKKHAFVAAAATPDPAVKKRYFETYLQPDQPPEQWMQESLATFHWPGQEELTLPYLRPALDRLEWVKEHRKIFFMPAWIAAFVGGHSDRRALRIVEEFLEQAEQLPRDIRLKVLQSLDGLRRAVRIKERWP